MSENQSAEDLSDEFLETELQTTSDGFIRARVKSIRGYEDEIFVKAELPSGETVSQTFKRPSIWKSNEQFVRFVEQYGYDAGTFNHLVGDKVKVHPDVPSPFVIANEWQYSVFRKIIGLLILLGAISIPIGIGWVVYHILTSIPLWGLAL